MIEGLKVKYEIQNLELLQIQRQKATLKDKC